MSQKKGRCNFCRSYPFLSQRRKVYDTPPVLVLTAGLEKLNESASSLWSAPEFLPESIGLHVYQDGRVFCTQQGLDDKTDRFSIFDLVGVIVQIFNARDQKSHLVSLINGTATQISITFKD